MPVFKFNRFVIRGQVKLWIGIALNHVLGVWKYSIMWVWFIGFVKVNIQSWINWINWVCLGLCHHKPSLTGYQYNCYTSWTSLQVKPAPLSCDVNHKYLPNVYFSILNCINRILGTISVFHVHLNNHRMIKTYQYWKSISINKTSHNMLRLSLSAVIYVFAWARNFD